MTYREKIPGAVAASASAAPSYEQIALTKTAEVGSTFPALRLDADHGTVSTGNFTGLADVVTGTVYPYAPVTSGNATAMFQQVSVNGINVFDGERAGNPANIRRGYALPAAQTAAKNQIAVWWCGRVPASTWTNHATAGSQTVISYLFGATDTSTTYLWRARETATQIEISAKRASGDASWITASVLFDTTKWHFCEMAIDFVAGTATLTVYTVDGLGNTVLVGSSTATGMVGTSGPSQAAGGADLIDFGYQFYSTGSAQQFYGQIADLLVYPAALSYWDRFGLIEHSARRAFLLNGGS